MLRILASLLGPVFAKEAVEMSRRKRYYFVRVLYGLILLLTMFIVWDQYDYYFRNDGYNYYGYGYRSRLDMMAEFAHSLFVGICLLQYGAVLLFVPVIVCSVIAGEREANSLELLFTTHLTDREIVLGKLASRMAVVLVLVASTLPVMALTMLFGGIEPGALLRTQFATLMALLFVASHAIFFSSISRSPTGALVRTYWWLAVILLAPAVAAMIFVTGLRINQNDWLALVVWGQAFTNPLFQFGFGLTEEVHTEVSRFLGEWFYPFTFLLPVAWSCLLLALAVKRLRIAPSTRTWWARWLESLQRVFAPGSPQVQFEKPDNAVHPLAARTATTAKSTAGVNAAVATLSAPLIAELVEDSAADEPLPPPLPERPASNLSRPAGAPARGERTWWGWRVANPLWLRARQARVYDREHHVGRIIWAGWGLALFFFLLMAALSPRDLDDEECAMVFLSVTWIVIAVLSAIVASTSFVADRRRGFLELVLCSPLKAREVLDGTLLAVLQHVKWALPIPVILSVLFWLVGATGWLALLVSLVTGMLYFAMIVLHGVVASLPARSAPQALIPTFLLPVLMIVGLPIAIVMFEEESAPLVWVLAAAALPATWYWVRSTHSAAATGAFLAAVHLGLMLLASCWNFAPGQEEFPLVTTNPGYWIIAPLEMDRNYSAYRALNSYYHWYRGAWGWPAAVGLFWAALLADLVLVRAWCLWKFNRLADRLAIERPSLRPVNVSGVVYQPARVEAGVAE